MGFRILHFVSCTSIVYYSISLHRISYIVNIESREVDGGSDIEVAMTR